MSAGQTVGAHPSPSDSRWPHHPVWQKTVVEVNRLGLETGREHAATLAGSGQRVGPIAAGQRHTVVVSDEVRSWLHTPGAELAVCHNHPAHPGEVPNELSPSDFVLLGCAGVRSVHMVSSYEPDGYSIAQRIVELDSGTWLAGVRLARDIAWALATSDETCRYLVANGLESLDHQRVLVRLLSLVGLIEWTRRFDGATADLEHGHGRYFDGLAERGAEEFVRRLNGVGARVSASRVS